MTAEAHLVTARRSMSVSESAGELLDVALERARAGEEAGFLLLWRELQPRVLRYLQVYAGDGAEDIAAETWLHVVRDLRGFRGNVAAFRAWLFAIARNRAIDAGRHRSSRPVVLVPDTAMAGEPLPAASAEAEAFERMSTERALDLVATLPPEQAEVVLLRVVGGLDVGAVARIVGKSPGAVRVSVHRGLQTLARKPQAWSEEMS